MKDSQMKSYHNAKHIYIESKKQETICIISLHNKTQTNNGKLQNKSDWNNSKSDTKVAT